MCVCRTDSRSVTMLAGGCVYVIGLSVTTKYFSSVPAYTHSCAVGKEAGVSKTSVLIRVQSRTKYLLLTRR